ncbi:hypothetical protein D6D15_06420 [Aureobasidium pullulans]|uniref:Uncharacterized protein n=1 Tax=Aureobasidium pullulans TaxID=5580 RepID=A0A4S9B4V8_AURPU|nr:hypothetical protein D6D15_06420 [Aureobasidium pullulans]
MKMLHLLYRPSYHLRPRYSNSIVSSFWLLGQSRYSTRAGSEEAPTHQHVTHMADDKARDKASEAGAHENLRAYQRHYQKEYRDRNREKIRAAQRLYREQNKDKLKAYREQNKDKIKRWHQEHKEEAKAYRERNKDKLKAYRDQNKDKIKRWYQEHKEQVKAYRERNKDKIKAYREQNKDKMKAYKARYHQQHKQRVAELVRQWNKKNPSRRYEYGRQWSLKNRELYLQKMAEYRLKCSNLGLFDRYKAAKREKYNSDKQYRMAVRLYIWVTRSVEARQLSWPTHQPILYDTKQSYHCSGCGHGRYIKLWWEKLDENRNPTGELSCHACFISDWSRALPIGHENMFVNKRPRHRSPEKAPDDNIEDKTETGPSDKPDPPT